MPGWSTKSLSSTQHKEGSEIPGWVQGRQKVAVGSAGGHNDHVVPSDGFAARRAIVNKRVSSSYQRNMKLR